MNSTQIIIYFFYSLVFYAVSKCRSEVPKAYELIASFLELDELPADWNIFKCSSASVYFPNRKIKEQSVS